MWAWLKPEAKDLKDGGEKTQLQKLTASGGALGFGTQAPNWYEWTQSTKKPQAKQHQCIKEDSTYRCIFSGG